MMKLVAAAGLLMLGTAAAFAQSCENGNDLWEHAGEEGRYIYYLQGEAAATRPARIEFWQGDDMVWRLNGERSCGDGIFAEVCYVSFEMREGAPLDGYDYPMASAESFEFSERIGDADVRFVGLANLGPHTVGWRPRVVDRDGEPVEIPDGNLVVLPSVFRHAGCHNLTADPVADTSLAIEADYLVGTWSRLDSPSCDTDSPGPNTPDFSIRVTPSRLEAAGRLCLYRSELLDNVIVLDALCELPDGQVARQEIQATVTGPDEMVWLWIGAVQVDKYRRCD